MFRAHRKTVQKPFILGGTRTLSWPVIGGIRIGVLGGIGPEATARFYGNLIKALQKEGIDSNLDYPQIFINSIPANELIHETASEEDLRMYVNGIRELDGMHPDFVVLVCNTIHLFMDLLAEHAGSEIFDLRKEVRRCLVEKKRVLVLGTMLTVNSGLYRFDGVNYETLNGDELEILQRAISKFNLGKDYQEEKRRITDICNKSVNSGTDCVVLGCTELVGILENEDLPTLDTINLLVDGTIRRLNEIRSRKES